ncbi:MAG: surface-adhesin E family protein, partial [Burkholderiales bacterium]
PTTFYQGTGYKGALGERPTPDKHGAYPRPVLELQDFNKPLEKGALDRPALVSARPDLVASRGAHVEFDCIERRQRVQPLYGFGGHMASGVVGVTRYFYQSLLEPQEWKKVVPGTIPDTLLRLVCK